MAKINWNKAKRYYLADPTRSYSDVSKKFKISTKAIRDYQQRNNESWVEMRRETNKKVSKNLPDLLGEQMAEVQARHAQYGKMLQVKGITRLQDYKDDKGNLKKGFNPMSYNEAMTSIKDGVEIERNAWNLNSRKAGFEMTDGEKSIRVVIEDY